MKEYLQLLNKLNNSKNESLIGDIKTGFSIRKLKKGEYFLKADEDLIEIGFINKGLLRYFYIDNNGNDITKYFTKENDFVLSFAAFTGKKSPFFIQALEDTQLLAIEVGLLKKLIITKEYWKDFYLSILEESYLEKEEREADFLFMNASERYLKLKKNKPELLQRVQQQYIASFLGVTPVSLSRLLTKSLIK